MSQVDTTITHITEANVNIFEELGFDKVEAEKLKIKAQLMCQISEWIKEKELKQEEASKLLQVTRPRISDVIRGRMKNIPITKITSVTKSVCDTLKKLGKGPSAIW